MQSDGSWLRTDIRTEALKGLRTCRRHLADGLTDAYQLKWAALAITTSLQAFILWTYRTVEILAWDDGAAQELADYEEGNRQTPPSVGDIHLPSFLPLCEKLRDERGWDPNETVWQGIERLRDLRDEFMHFKPKYLGVTGPHLREAIRAALDAIDYVIRDQPGHFRWDDEHIRDAVELELHVARRLAAEPTE